MDGDLEPELLERADALRELTGLLDVARRAGRAVVLEGPLGIGKTALLERLGRAAVERGFDVLGARGGELERRLSLGVVRQLVEGRLLATGETERARLLADNARWAGAVLLDGDRVEEAMLLHALYRLWANLARDRPLLVAVDDTQWCDPSSLRALAYLARRLNRLPIMLALATEPVLPHAEHAGLLGGIAAEPLAVTVRPAPLTVAAIGDLVRRRLGREPHPRFAEACREAAGGNPLLTESLLAAAASDGVEPSEEEAARVQSLVGEDLRRNVQLRLATVPPPARDLAQAIAVLGPAASLRVAGAMADLRPPEAGQAADALVHLGLLRPGLPLEFAHPVLRSAVYASLSMAARPAAHRRAARLLHRDDAPLHVVAMHLLSSEPEGERWVVESLRRAAAAELVPEVAASYLRRALAEPPDAQVKPRVLLELGSAELAAQRFAAAYRHLQAASRNLSEPTERASAARWANLALLAIGRSAEAAEVLRDALHDLGNAGREPDSEIARLRLELEAEAFLWSQSGERRELEVLAREIETRGSPAARASLAFSALFCGGDVAQAAAWADSALADGTLRRDPAAVVFHLRALLTLVFAGQLGRADEHVARALSESPARASISRSALLSWARAEISLRAGAILRAESDARSALETAREHGLEYMLPVAAATLARVLVERGRPSAAWRALTAWTDREGTTSAAWLAAWVHARAVLLLREGRAAEAVQGFERCGRLLRAHRHDHPGFLPWRSCAAHAYRLLGEWDVGRPLAEEELRLARGARADAPVGAALRARALLDGREADIRLLEEAVGALERSEERLELGRALVDLGAALRRRRGNRAAREPLRRALEIADGGGAHALAARAWDELTAAGARPRRAARSGVAALTASERRVGELASAGLSNREIARELFVTVKTVEKHLGNAYQKLHVPSRSALAAALAGESPRATPAEGRRTGWWMRVRVAEACSCRVVCKWTLGLPDPDQGWCSCAMSIEVLEGESEGVDLTRARAVVGFDRPRSPAGAIDRAKLYLDAGLGDDQRGELERVLHGRRGGVWAHIAAAVRTWEAPSRCPIDASSNGSMKVSVEGAGQIVLRPLREEGRPVILKDAPFAAAFAHDALELALAVGSSFHHPPLRTWESLGHGATYVAEWSS